MQRPQPVTFGALPSLSPSGTGWHTFTFHYNPDIKNCIVTGPQNVKAAEIRTQSGQTRFAGSGQTFANIQWGTQPIVEIVGTTQRQYAGQFLSLQYQPDQTSYRRMDVGGKSYRWTAKPEGTYLYKSGGYDTDPVARIRMTSLQTVVLELKGEAFPAGLFQPCIAATVLLYSGQSIA
ncbi:hypothetical protein CPC08DRAFT_762741 [Agrocybe pediades]|nr:hypothetical protein CPC08DRAFT_762741 [Agrocybe pediades]